MYEGQQSDQIRILPIEPPEALAETLGYGGQARTVAFYWGAGDEAYYYDGHLSTQAEWDTYLLFVRHPLIAPALQGYNLGSSEEEATHWLLLDREAPQITIAPARVAQQVLTAQWGHPTPEEVMIVDREAWEQLVTEMVARIERISQEQIVAQMFEHQLRVQTLATWLEMKWNEQRLHEQQEVSNKPTLADIETLATQLEFDFDGSPQKGWFDLDKRGSSPSVGGTFRNDEAGIADAYSYLVRYRHELERLEPDP